MVGPENQGVSQGPESEEGIGEGEMERRVFRKDKIPFPCAFTPTGRGSFPPVRVSEPAERAQPGFLNPWQDFREFLNAREQQKSMKEERKAEEGSLP